MPGQLYTSTQSRRSTKNHILNALPDKDFERLAPDLEKVEMRQGKVLYHPDEPIKHVYFPNTSIISVVTTTAEGQMIEVGIIGWEGLAGFDVLMGVDSMPNGNMVQLADSGLRIAAANLKREFERGGALQILIMRFIHKLMIQMGRVSLCNRLHTNEERLSRWLLMCQDRSLTKELKLTQEFLSMMLGSNRSTVTLSALALQNAGYIKYSRGLIIIENRAGLEDFACDCYQAIKREYDRLQK